MRGGERELDPTSVWQPERGVHAVDELVGWVHWDLTSQGQGWYPWTEQGGDCVIMLRQSEQTSGKDGQAKGRESN